MEAWHGGVSVSSNMARSHAPEVAAAASVGLITTGIGIEFTRAWAITGKGIEYLNGKLEEITNDHN